MVSTFQAFCILLPQTPQKSRMVLDIQSNHLLNSILGPLLGSTLMFLRWFVVVGGMRKLNTKAQKVF